MDKLSRRGLEDGEGFLPYLCMISEPCRTTLHSTDEFDDPRSFWKQVFYFTVLKDHFFSPLIYEIGMYPYTKS